MQMFERYTKCPHCDRLTEQSMVSQYMTSNVGKPAYLKTIWHCLRCLKRFGYSVVLCEKLEGIILEGAGGEHKFK